MIFTSQYREKIFRKLLLVAAFIVIVILLLIFYTLTSKSMLALNELGISFFYGSVWDPVKEVFGALPFLVGTLVTAVLALLISLVFSYSLAIYIGEYLKKGFVRELLNTIIDLLAGIPSVIYGFWGLFVVVPLVREFQLMIGVVPNGVGIFASSLVLALMIIPYSASISKEVIALVPVDLKEAALGLGATRAEVVWKVVLPYARSGMLAGVLMSFGRAISETMAVTMLIGNSNRIPDSIFSPANSLASVLANEFAEASDPLYLSSLVALALVLFLLTAAFSFFGRIIIKKVDVVS